MDNLITGYEVNLVEPECAPGSARFGIQVVLPNDISPVFPYLNAILNDVWYDHENKFLIWEESGQKYALRPNEIRVARIEDVRNAPQEVRVLVDRVNEVWQERDSIIPRFAERKLPTVLDILRFLPRSNCRRCGYPTCMAFAAVLRKSRAALEQCRPLLEPQYSENREKVASLLTPD